jgi:hypothetical protein
LLRIFKRKILRRICGPVQKGDIWRIRNNEELNRSIKREDIVKFIKAQRIRWLGHVKKMEVGALPRKMMEGRLFIEQRRGRPHLRWMDDITGFNPLNAKLNPICPLLALFGAHHILHVSR